MIENEVKAFVNAILKREEAKELQAHELLQESELDSFGYILLFFELDGRYKCFDTDYTQTLDFEQYTLEDVVQRVKACKSTK